MKHLIILIAAFALTTCAFAQNQTPRADAREAAQHTRIAQGRQSGELTRGETRALRMEQRNIRRTERRAKSDGEVTPREKRKLERKQDRANRDIRRAKHNGRDNN